MAIRLLVGLSTSLIDFSSKTKNKRRKKMQHHESQNKNSGQRVEGTYVRIKVRVGMSNNLQ